MGIFSGKRKISYLELCRDFYDRFVFADRIADGDPHQLFSESTLRLITDADASFSSVSVDEFAFNLLAMRLEVIGTAWSHKSKDIVALKISEFTKAYLEESDRQALWVVMSVFNQAVAESATYGADSNTRLGRSRITFINSMRTGLFDEWTQGGHDPEAAARVANRHGTEPMWKDGVVQGLLAITLTKQLRHDGSDEIWGRLASVAEGFYQGATDAIRDVKLTT